MSKRIKTESFRGNGYNLEFVFVHDFYINGLGLKPSEAIIFSIVCGFSSDGESSFKGGIPYLASRANMSEVQVRRVLQNLTNEGYLTMIPKKVNNIVYHNYKVSDFVLEEITKKRMFTPNKRE